MNTPINFDSKDVYIKWRQQWRQEYQVVSEQIRKAKASLRDAQRKGCASWDRFQLVIVRKAEARRMMEVLEHSKTIVRNRLRSLGIPAPDPKVREKPAPRPKKRWTPEQIAEARYCFEVRGADGHNS